MLGEQARYSAKGAGEDEDWRENRVQAVQDRCWSAELWGNPEDMGVGAGDSLVSLIRAEILGDRQAVVSGLAEYAYHLTHM